MIQNTERKRRGLTFYLDGFHGPSKAFNQKQRWRKNQQEGGQAQQVSVPYTSQPCYQKRVPTISLPDLPESDFPTQANQSVLSFLPEQPLQGPQTTKPKQNLRKGKAIEKEPGLFQQFKRSKNPFIESCRLLVEFYRSPGLHPRELDTKIEKAKSRIRNLYSLSKEEALDAFAAVRTVRKRNIATCAGLTAVGFFSACNNPSLILNPVGITSLSLIGAAAKVAIIREQGLMKTQLGQNLSQRYQCQARK